MMRPSHQTISKLLLTSLLGYMLVLTNIASAEHDCHHPDDETQHDCTLCLLSISSAENSNSQTLDPPQRTEHSVSLPDATPRAAELPRSHAPRSPPSL